MFGGTMASSPRLNLHNLPTPESQERRIDPEDGKAKTFKVRQIVGMLESYVWNCGCPKHTKENIPKYGIGLKYFEVIYQLRIIRMNHGVIFIG